MAPKVGPTPFASKRPSGVLQRGLGLLNLLVDASQPLSLARLAQASGIDPSSALRILRVLEEQGYALRDPLSRGYLAGPRALFPLDLHHPIAAYRRSAQPVARQIADETGFTTGVHLFLLDSRLTIDIAQGSNPLTPFYDTQAKRGPHASATGKLFLAGLSAERRSRLLGPSPHPTYTERTVTDTARLDAELAEAGRQGYASALGEGFAWLTTVAAPVRSRSHRVVGAFSVFATIEQLSRAEIPVIGQRLRRSADMFSHSCPALDSIEQLIGGGI